MTIVEFFSFSLLIIIAILSGWIGWQIGDWLDNLEKKYFKRQNKDDDAN